MRATDPIVSDRGGLGVPAGEILDQLQLVGAQSEMGDAELGPGDAGQLVEPGVAPDELRGHGHANDVAVERHARSHVGDGEPDMEQRLRFGFSHHRLTRSARNHDLRGRWLG